jgi:hypothetical protein
MKNKLEKIHLFNAYIRQQKYAFTFKIDWVAVIGANAAVILGWNGSEGLAGPGNTG